MAGLKHGLKRVLSIVAPNATLRLSSSRSRGLIERQVARLGLDQLARDISSATGSKVASGPFEGMKLDYEALPVHSAPKLLGTYESEIHAFIEHAIGMAPAVVLNVGASEGYYAVGFGLRLPSANILFAEADSKSIAATHHNSSLNGIADRVTAIGIVHRGEFGIHIGSRSCLIFMDCEGAEFALLDPRHEPALEGASIIVEVHEEFGRLEELVARFANTHSIDTVHSKPRTLADMPISVPNSNVMAALDERRGNQSWAYMRPKR